MKSIQISIWELMEGVKFLVSNKEESSSSVDCWYSEEEDTLDLKSDEEGSFRSPPLTNQVADQPMPIIALASVLANNHQMDQREVLQSPDSLKTEPVLRNVEAIKQFMRSGRKNPNAV
ncbi:hypothetical protein L1987_53427 [Smallanthus sonchifolius]|uniref:Uncharacterized protein n=1 Tax=Smallanthus sonchifolius TaxID=185202 RepID=A0ACB9EVX1_9ASTR|nr:hypothetical protein L1987_53427 [Smallanthus sonchifolius]